MTMANGVRTYQFKALTNLWTGDLNRNAGRLITTGLLGSIRWWFEVLVRGLEGSACDPTDTKCEGRKHCVVCELFGCTGWARKFRFDALDNNGDNKTDQIKQNDTFKLRFTPLRPIRGEEWALLDATLRLIANYGAIGGKTVFKPTDELSIANVALSEVDKTLKVKSRTVGSPLKQRDQILNVCGQLVKNMQELKIQLQDKNVGCPITITIKRNSITKDVNGWVGKKHHQDYGLVQFSKSFEGNTSVAVMKDYATQDKWRKPKHDKFAWASLQHFWCVNGKYLARQNGNSSSFNRALGRKESKACRDCGQVHNPPNKCPATKRHPKRESECFINGNDKIAKWLAGSQQESKKVFSFKKPKRTFGFVKPGLIYFNAMGQRLTNAWGRNGWGFLTRNEIIDKLFDGKEDR